IIFWRFEQHRTALEISPLAQCSKKTVYNILCLHQDYSQVTNPFACRRGCSRILDAVDTKYIHALLQANPAMYLDELQEQLLTAQN
ncbi:hypothetical protein BDR03DRAFT_818745, partial [Suillus americanus]